MKINFGVIGTNVITERFLEAGKDAEGFCLRGVYSRSMEKAVDFARKHGADLAFDSLEDMASCKEIDAVYVASPNSLHASQSIQMLKGGKHVLCEKSIASNQREFEEMKKVALEKGGFYWKPCAVCTLPDFRLYGRTCISWEKSGGCLFNTVSIPEDMTTLRKGS